MRTLFLTFALLISVLGYSQSITMKGASWDDLSDEYITIRAELLTEERGYLAYVMFGEEKHILQSQGNTYDYAEFKFETNVLNLMATKGYHFAHRYQADKYGVHFILRKED